MQQLRKESLKSSQLRLQPVTRDVVRLFVQKHHSHHHRPNTYIAAVGVSNEVGLVCVAVLEIPRARMLCNGTTAEVSRVASDGSTNNAASMACGAISRAALALGYTRLVSYTILGEPGTMYRASNWHPTALSTGGEWGRPSRPLLQKSNQTGEKVRWEYGPDAAPADPSVDAIVREFAGKVEIPGRNDTLPLFGT